MLDNIPIHEGQALPPGLIGIAFYWANGDITYKVWNGDKISVFPPDTLFLPKTGIFWSVNANKMEHISHTKKTVEVEFHRSYDWEDTSVRWCGSYPPAGFEAHNGLVYFEKGFSK